MTEQHDTELASVNALLTQRFTNRRLYCAHARTRDVEHGEYEGIWTLLKDDSSQEEKEKALVDSALITIYKYTRYETCGLAYASLERDSSPKDSFVLKVGWVNARHKSEAYVQCMYAGHSNARLLEKQLEAANLLGHTLDEWPQCEYTSVVECEDEDLECLSEDLATRLVDKMSANVEHGHRIPYVMLQRCQRSGTPFSSSSWQARYDVSKACAM